MACRNITLDPLSFKVFVETLDKCFENVCELDLIFHMDKVHFILNELVMGGMVLETNMNEILTRIEEQNKIEREEVRGIIIYTGHREMRKSCDVTDAVKTFRKSIPLIPAGLAL